MPNRIPHGSGRTLTYCGDKFGQCLFSKRQAPEEGLPVVVVDEEIYRRLPTLLIATVDKFAQMPWKGEVQMLFGQVNGFCARHGFRSPEIEDSTFHPKSKLGLPAAKTLEHPPLRPPDLIIQDELHLISGPLGTLVGLYETAIDKLCTWEVNGKKVRPKLIASTATIKNADVQVRSLFLRTVNIFPPPDWMCGTTSSRFSVSQPKRRLADVTSASVPRSPVEGGVDPGVRRLSLFGPIALREVRQVCRSMDDPRGLLQFHAGTWRDAASRR